MSAWPASSSAGRITSWKTGKQEWRASRKRDTLLLASLAYRQTKDSFNSCSNFCTCNVFCLNFYESGERIPPSILFRGGFPSRQFARS